MLGLFRKKVKELTTNKTYKSEFVVGESNYFTALQTIWQKTNPKDRPEAVFVPERGNKFDENAVRVEIMGKTVGYLRKDVAAKYRTEIGDISTCCTARLSGGFELENGEKANIGVSVNFKQPFGLIG